LNEKIEIDLFFTSFLTNISNSEAETIEKCLYEEINRIACIIKANCTYIFQFDKDLKKIEDAYYWCCEENFTKPDIFNLDRLPEVFTLLKNYLENYKIININVEEITGSITGLTEYLSKKKIKSLLIIPMVFQSKLAGILVFMRKDRANIWSDSVISLLNLISTILISIFKRIKIGEALKESEKRFKDFVNFLPQTVFEVDLNGYITFSNLLGLETFGINNDDIEKE